MSDVWDRLYSTPTASFVNSIKVRSACEGREQTSALHNRLCCRWPRLKKSKQKFAMAIDLPLFSEQRVEGLFCSDLVALVPLRFVSTNHGRFSSELQAKKEGDHLDFALGSVYDHHAQRTASVAQAVHQPETKRMEATHVPTPHAIFSKTGHPSYVLDKDALLIGLVTIRLPQKGGTVVSSPISNFVTVRRRHRYPPFDESPLVCANATAVSKHFLSGPLYRCALPTRPFVIRILLAILGDHASCPRMVLVAVRYHKTRVIPIGY